MMPITRIPGVIYDFRNDAINDYNRAYAARAAAMGVPYLDLFTPLATNPEWTESLRQSDGLHPTAAGYELMTAHVCGWAGWRALFDG